MLLGAADGVRIGFGSVGDGNVEEGKRGRNGRKPREGGRGREERGKEARTTFKFGQAESGGVRKTVGERGRRVVEGEGGGNLGVGRGTLVGYLDEEDGAEDIAERKEVEK
jgi:hypothetical protein